MSEMPQTMPRGEESAEPQELPAGKPMVTKWVFNRRMWPLKIMVLVLLVVLWCCHDSINSWLHDQKEAAYEYDTCIRQAHFFVRNAWVVVVYGIVWVVTGIDELRSLKWFWSALMALCAEIYYYSVLLPCGNLVGVCFWILMAGSIAVLVRSCFKAVRVYSPPDELLGRGKVYNEILEHLIGAFSGQDRGTSMAIIGNWGTGKSHCLQSLKHVLTQGNNQKNFRVCEVDLWQMSTVEEGFEAIASELEYALTGRGKPNRKSFLHILKFGFKCLFSISGIGGSNFEQVLDYITEEGNSKQKFYADEFSKKIKQECGNGGIVLIMDNVERANNDVLQNMLPLIEKLKEVRQLAIVCSIDIQSIKRKEFLNKHGINSNAVDGYFSKLFDEQYVLPEISTNGMKRLQDKMLQKYGNRSRVRDFLIYNTILFETPRQIERVVAHLSYIDKSYLENIEHDKRNSYLRRGYAGDFKETGQCFSLQWDNYEYNARDVYLVTTLQLLYKVICDDILSAHSLSKYLENFSARVYKHAERKEIVERFAALLPEKDEINKATKWNEEHTATAFIVRRDSLAWSLLRELKTTTDKSFLYCFQHRYERIDRFNSIEAGSVISASVSHSEPIEQIIHSAVRNHFIDDVGKSKKYLLSYASHHLKSNSSCLHFLHKYIQEIFASSDVSQIDYNETQYYVMSEIFFFPLIVNLANSSFKDHNAGLAVSTCDLIINHFNLVKVANVLKKIFASVTNITHTLEITMNRIGESINVRQVFEGDLYRHCIFASSCQYLKTLVIEWDQPHAIKRFANPENYYYYDTINAVAQEVILSHSPRLSPADGAIWFQRLHCMISFLSMERAFFQDEDIAQKCRYVHPRLSEFLSPYISDIIKFERLSQCSSQQITDLRNHCIDAREGLVSAIDTLTKFQTAVDLSVQNAAIQLLSSCEKYLEGVLQSHRQSRRSKVSAKK